MFNTSFNSAYLNLLHNRINLREIPFTERGSRILIYGTGNHLSLRLAERWSKISPQISAYRQRKPILEEWYFTDPAGNPIGFELDSYPHRLDFSTSAGLFTLTFVDEETLLLCFPPGRCGISFRANMDQVLTDRRGGVLHLTGDIRRNLAYTTSAHLLRNETEAIDSQAIRVHLIFDTSVGGSLMLNITPRLGFNRYMRDPAIILDRAAQRWHDWFAAAPPVPAELEPVYYFSWWIMRAGLISPRFYTTREAMTPSKMYYVGVWQWDAYFHALAYRHIDSRLAQDQLRIVLDHQREDGMIPDAVHDEGIITHLSFPIDADVTKPPLIAWAAWKLYEKSRDLEFLNEIYEPIVRSNNWWFTYNDLNRNGLCEYFHPFSSGLDDSPLWDDGMPVESPDLNTYLYLQQEALGNISAALGLAKDARLWRSRSKAMVDRLVRLMWDAPTGYFRARANGHNVAVRTPFGLLPLITGRLPLEINQRLVANLTDPRQFWAEYPIPTVALDDPKFDPDQMWRGPSWVNINYLFIEGLHRTGFTDLAGELRRRTINMLSAHDNIYEYYNPLNGNNPPKAAPVFGWSSAVLIDLAIQAAQEGGL